MKEEEIQVSVVFQLYFWPRYGQSHNTDENKNQQSVTFTLNTGPFLGQTLQTMLKLTAYPPMIIEEEKISSQAF